MKSKISTLVAAAVAAPALAIIGAVVSAQEGGGPVELLGETLACPNAAQVRERFAMEGDNWSVTGVMTAGPDISITVAGPSGEVTVVPTVNLEVGAGVQLSQPVTMRGSTVAATGEMVATSLTDACAGAASAPTAAPDQTATGQEDDDPGEDDDAGEDAGAGQSGVCNRGAGRPGELRMHINRGGVHIQRGAVTSSEGGSLVVETPDGPLTVVLDGDTKIKGDPNAGTEVKVRGEMDDGVVVAEEVKVLCPHSPGERGEGEGEKHEGDEDDDDEDEGDEDKGEDDDGDDDDDDGEDD